MPLYRDDGIVLRTHKLGEADRVVVLLTAQHGKLRAVAKGVRKTKSRMGARLEPMSHVALQLYQGRGELETVSQAESIDHFRAVRDNLDRLTKALSLLEVVDQIAPDRQPVPRLHAMLLGGLRSLAATNAAMLVPAFYLKLLASEGVGPQVVNCVSCGSAEDLVAFDPTEGGVLCRNCRRGFPISPAALELLRRTLGGGLIGVLNEVPSAVTHEVEVLANRSMEAHLERKLRVSSIIDR
ncbi:MAG: recO [Acidimicrobiia bacterium]|nr:recO [Acidimicrobiia bacterium]